MFKLVAFVFGCLFIELVLGKKAGVHQILGGVAVPEGTIPYQASIRNKYNRSLCGGAILDHRWVLTAAHCTIGRSPDDVKIVVGTNDLTSGGVSYSVDSIINHEGYTDAHKGNDISLVKVSTDIKFSDLVQPIQLPIQNTGAGVDVLASGWGLTSNDGKRTTDLQMIKLKTISVEQCRRDSISDKRDIYDSQICTYTAPGEGTCRGDSGGPLVDEYGDEVIGVISWGEPCAIGYPDVYTRVYSFKDWIQKKMA